MLAARERSKGAGQKPCHEISTKETRASLASTFVWGGREVGREGERELAGVGQGMDVWSAPNMPLLGRATCS